MYQPAVFYPRAQPIPGLVCTSLALAR